jgi:hypothetical protein
VFTCRTPTHTDVRRAKAENRPACLPEEVMVDGWRTIEVVEEVTVAVSVCGPTWDGLRRLVMGLQQESALALLETAAAFIGGVGWTGIWLRQLDVAFLPWRRIGRFHMLIIRQSGRMSR